MTIREKFKIRVIELIHGLPYEEAIKKEPYCCNNENDECYHKPKITIGRFIQAVENKKEKDLDNIILDKIQIGILRYWKRTKENGEECTDDNQTDETIEKLYNLIKSND